MIKSPLRYPGGKSRAVKTLLPLVPAFGEYREPFVGGGSVFASLLQRLPAKRYWINDLYPNLYYFWRQAQQNPQALIAQIQQWRGEFSADGKRLFRFLRARIETFDEVEKAAAFFAFNRITFSGTAESGGYSQNAFDKRFTPSSIARVAALAGLLDKVKITNEDYQSVVEAAGTDVFIFLDPPYYSARQSALYGKGGALHKQFDHERLAATLAQTQHRWLATYDDSAYIRRLYSFAHIQTWRLTYGMRNVGSNGNQQASELLISNFPLTTTHLC